MYVYIYVRIYVCVCIYVYVCICVVPDQRRTIRGGDSTGATQMYVCGWVGVFIFVWVYGFVYIYTSPINLRILINPYMSNLFVCITYIHNIYKHLTNTHTYKRYMHTHQHSPDTHTQVP